MYALNRIHIQQSGLNKFLGSVETSIMIAVWGGARTARQIHTTIIRSDADLAYTTVTTVINRLVDKQLLRRDLNNPNAAMYIPTYTSERAFIYAAVQTTVLSLREDFSDELTEIVSSL